MHKRCSLLALIIPMVSACGPADDRPAVPSVYDPHAVPTPAADAGGPSDAASEEDSSAPPVVLDPAPGEARCGRWFCADQLPQSGSAMAVGDFDGDGRPDLLLADTGRLLSSLGPLTLLHNDGGMRFSDATLRAGLAGYGAWSAIFGDLDNDGDADLVLGGRRASEPAAESGNVLVFYNDGRGRFAPPVTVPRWGAGVPLALDLADLDADGQLDIIAALSGTNRRETYSPRVLSGQTDGSFVVQAAGLNDEGFTWVALATDLNGDQRPDVLMAHDGYATYQGTREEGVAGGCAPIDSPGSSTWLNAAYRNDGAAGDFSLSVQAADASWTSPDNTPMSLVRGDFDADGRMDLLTTQTGNPMMFDVTPEGLLMARPDWPGAWRRDSRNNQERGVGWGALARDLDRDGDADALVAYGVIPVSTTTWPNAVYLNDRAAGLTLAPEGTGLERPGEWSALAAADFDGDGDEDVVLGGQTLFRRPCDGVPPRALLMTNVSEWPGRHWLRVRLVGTVSNRDGLGARLEATSRNQTMLRELESAGSTMSTSSRVIDFGLGEATALETLVVRWPSGVVQTLRDVAGDREITVHEPRWMSVDARQRRPQEPVTVRLAAAAFMTGATHLDLHGGRWIDPPAVEEATGDLVGRFTGTGHVWVRPQGARTGLRAAVRVRFH